MSSDRIEVCTKEDLSKDLKHEAKAGNDGFKDALKLDMDRTLPLQMSPREYNNLIKAMEGRVKPEACLHNRLPALHLEKNS